LKLHEKIRFLSWAIGLGLFQAVALSAFFNDAFSAALQIVGMAFAIRVLNQSTAQFQWAWLYSTSWLIGSVWWLHIALHEHGNLPAIISIAAILILCGGLALYYTVALIIYAKFQDVLRPWQKSLLLAACWTMAEMARAQWFTGFPWAAVGYAQINSYLSMAAPWVGVYGIGFMAVFLAAFLGASNLEKRRQKIIAAMLVLILLIPNHRQSDNERPNVSVALLQANIPQSLKFNSGRAQALQWYKEQSLNSQAQITVLPETALPYLQKDLPEDYWQSLERKFSGSQQIAILGMLTLNDAGYANSAVAIGLQTTPSLYNKFHLVPFGEFTPYMFKWFTQMMSLGMTDFTRGSDAAAPFDWQHHKISVNICYEDVFGEELAKRFVQGDANVPSILVNISNIDWFGDTVVIPQHLNIARMRSLEFDRPSIRATNSGGTAIINAQGEITHQLLPFTRGVLKGEVASIDKEITPFAYWAGHWGLKPLWLLCLALLAWLIRQAKKNQNNGQGLAAANVK
jgi:apolipoprotein N-acyltransferase